MSSPVSSAVVALLLVFSAPYEGATVPHADRASTCGAPAAALAQPSGAPDELLALIEIPAGGQVKYELHAPSGRMQADRFLSMPVEYPINYGVLPCTLAGDGDELDVLVLTRIPLLPGSLIGVRPIGILPMVDGGEEDNKVLAVPLDSVDPHYRDVTDVGDLPQAERDRIQAFFRVYKMLPDSTVQVELGEWEGAAAATQAVRDALLPTSGGGAPD